MTHRHSRLIAWAMLASGLLIAGCDGASEDPAMDADDARDAAVDATEDLTTCERNASLQGEQCVCDAGYVQGEDGACVPEPAVTPAPGDLLIEELYYSGAAPEGGTDHYFSDQFIELVNTTDTPLDLSGVMVADVYGLAGEINPGLEPDSYAQSRPDQVVLSSVWRIPEGARLEAGASLVIAHDGTNHRPFSTIDLSGAGFESYVATSRGDDDHPTVENLEAVVFNGGFDWLISVFGDPWLELGTGLTEFVTLSQDDDIELVAGLQGGWHLDVGVRFGGFGPEGVRLVYEALDAEAARVSFVTQALLTERALLEDPEGWARVGDRVVIDLVDATELVGQRVILRVTAELGGQTWSDERRVTVVNAE